mmetsp:Transcript_17583/g.30281  ORF Transcript_17583/g.30281 Transcript_17583/m.30281 type:complete len:82 (+) Transcript_17583:148-393(+)|eukprot:CAMPEP_0196662172 /NCGR_PEP_ID=MMETSP1086-20130531/47481_1 /TAXON_ID=77921 /ORGANISM="Cyanoptyche  gloeocystis , Strain SAG4.97" /LENGTH=81 /DNA_ID=CAMNT_0041997405 /DNA_START=133 /DNA_END=378 /DNA_ORIENTATION=+
MNVLRDPDFVQNIFVERRYCNAVVAHDRVWAREWPDGLVGSDVNTGRKPNQSKYPNTQHTFSSSGNQHPDYTTTYGATYQN